MSACIETTNARNKAGYGCTYVMRFGKRERLTHRVAWIDANGRLPNPETPYILHTCDNPPCVNPEHLYEGTQKQNAADKIARGRHHNQQKECCPTCGGAYVVRSDGTRRRCTNCNAAKGVSRARERYAADQEYRERVKAQVRARYAAAKT